MHRRDSPSAPAPPAARQPSLMLPVLLLACFVATAACLPHRVYRTPHAAQVSLAAEDIRNEKVKVLRSMQALSLDDTVLGQYRSKTANGKSLPGYLDDKTVPKVRGAVRRLRPGRGRAAGVGVVGNDDGDGPY